MAKGNLFPTEVACWFSTANYSTKGRKLTQQQLRIVNRLEKTEEQLVSETAPERRRKLHEVRVKALSRLEELNEQIDIEARKQQ